MKFVKNTKYYTGTVYEWNLPTGSSCPFALECKVTVDRETGKFDIYRGQYKCYAAGPERFPGVREHRWKNFEYVKKGGIPEIPSKCNAIRIHASGDFFNQSYFDMWVELASQNPSVEIWAYTKSLNYWVKRINDIPNNLILTASKGGRLDYLIDEYNLKNVTIFANKFDVPDSLPIDTNDDYARTPNINFALIDNYAKPSKQTKLILPNT
jgi:hypothetical protein